MLPPMPPLIFACFQNGFSPIVDKSCARVMSAKMATQNKLKQNLKILFTEPIRVFNVKKTPFLIDESKLKNLVKLTYIKQYFKI